MANPAMRRAASGSGSRASMRIRPTVPIAVVSRAGPRPETDAASDTTASMTSVAGTAMSGEIAGNTSTPAMSVKCIQMGAAPVRLAWTWATALAEYPTAMMSTGMYAGNVPNRTDPTASAAIAT